MNLEIHLQTVGALEILLALAHCKFPRRFHWPEELARLSLLNRQIFYVHAFFVSLVLLLLGALNLACARELLIPGKLSGAILGGITLFWVTRWLFQFFVYDSRLWRGHKFNTAMHVAFSLLWTYFAGVYGWALWRQFV